MKSVNDFFLKREKAGFSKVIGMSDYRNKLRGSYPGVDGATSVYSGGGVFLGDTSFLLRSFSLSFLVFASLIEKETLVIRTPKVNTYFGSS